MIREAFDLGRTLGFTKRAYETDPDVAEFLKGKGHDIQELVENQALTEHLGREYGKEHVGDYFWPAVEGTLLGGSGGLLGALGGWSPLSRTLLGLGGAAGGGALGALIGKGIVKDERKRIAKLLADEVDELRYGQGMD
jgi:hypothetical protein